MKILVTGAGGFIGATLVALLQQRGQAGGRRISSLAVLDRQLGETAPDMVRIEGNLQDAQVQAQIAAFGAV